MTGVGSATTMTYDANGNMNAKTDSGQMVNYVYDTENHLTQVKQGSTILAQYDYDDQGGRIQKTAGGSTTRFINGMYEEAGSNKTIYVMMGSTRVATINNGAVFTYHGDHLGGTNIITDATGHQNELIEYQPYGKTSIDQKTNPNQTITNYYFTGQYLDGESSLYYYGARYYNADIGRFVTPDWIVQAPENPQTLNRYAYALNNPINRIDPTGNFSFGGFLKDVIQNVSGVIGSFIQDPVGAFFSPFFC